MVTVVGEQARRTTVYVVDDDPEIRKSLSFLLAATGVTVRPFARAADFLAQVSELPPAPLLLDIRMPEIDGLQVLAMLKDRSVDWPVIIMSAHGDIKAAVQAMKLGAIEFLEKPFQPEMLDEAIDRAFDLVNTNGESMQSRDGARRLIDRLSPREREVISVLMKGVLNKIAAHRLGLSVRTIEMHRSHALVKLGLRSIAEVITLATTAQLTIDLAALAS